MPYSGLMSEGCNTGPKNEYKGERDE
jgi:hypothetical protein